MPFLVTATSMCEEVLTPSTDCIMLTPVITCTTYEVFNITGSRVDNGSLTVLNDSIYQFTMNQPVGGYIVKLCDDTTREVIVKSEDKNMAWLAIIISIGVMTSLFFYASSLLKKAEMLDLKKFLFSLGLINTFLLGALTWVISNNPTTPASFLPVSLGYLTVNGMGMLIFIWFFGMDNIFGVIRKNKGGL